MRNIYTDKGVIKHKCVCVYIHIYICNYVCVYAYVCRYASCMHGCRHAYTLHLKDTYKYKDQRLQKSTLTSVMVWALASNCNVANTETWHPASARRCSERHRAQQRLNRYPFGMCCRMLPAWWEETFHTSPSSGRLFWCSRPGSGPDPAARPARWRGRARPARSLVTCPVLRSVAGVSYSAPPRLLSWWDHQEYHLAIPVGMFASCGQKQLNCGPWPQSEACRASEVESHEARQESRRLHGPVPKKTRHARNSVTQRL